MIQSVSHVCRLSADLLPVSSINEQCYGVYFDNSNIEVIDINNLQIVACRKKEPGMHQLNSSNIPLPFSKSHILQLLHPSYALVAQQESSIVTCLLFVQELSSSQIVHDLPHFNISNTGFYTCKAPPQTSPSQATHHATSMLGLVHLDLFGSM
mgnify:CR=1 FL=1